MMQRASYTFHFLLMWGQKIHFKYLTQMNCGIASGAGRLTRIYSICYAVKIEVISDIQINNEKEKHDRLVHFRLQALDSLWFLSRLLLCVLPDGKPYLDRRGLLFINPSHTAEGAPSNISRQKPPPVVRNSTFNRTTSQTTLSLLHPYSQLLETK